MWRDHPAVRAIGGLSSAGVVAGSYIAVALVALLLSRAAAGVAAVLSPLLVFGYCVLRQTRRGEVANMAISPGILGSMAHDMFGIAGWQVALPLAIFVVAGLAHDDRKDSRAKPS